MTLSPGVLLSTIQPISFRISKNLSLKKKVKSTILHLTPVNAYYHHYSCWQQEDNLIVASLVIIAREQLGTVPRNLHIHTATHLKGHRELDNSLKETVDRSTNSWRIS